MSLRQTISEAQKNAMKEGQKEALSTLRMLWSALRNTEIDKGLELNDEEVQQLITRQVKQLKDSIVDFEKGGRSDLIQQTQQEITLLSKYLPEQMSDEALMSIVEQTITTLAGEKNTGIVMGAVMKEVKGKADGKRVRECVERMMNQ